MKKLAVLLFLFSSISISLLGQTQILNEPDHIKNAAASSYVYPSTFRSFSDITEELNSAFDEVSSSSSISGFNAAVRLPDGTIWERSSGIANALPDTLGMETDHHMGMGSITKTFVSSTLLSMMEDGLLSLEDSIGTYIDSYPNIDGSATISQLLGMRTGFNDYLNENPATIVALNNDLEHLWEVDSILHNFVLAPNFNPGESWSYSNTNYLIAGKIIEEISNNPWYEELRTRILEPIGLDNTYAYPWEGQSIKQASVFSDFDQNGTVDDIQGNGITLDGFFSLASSAGNLVTLPKDLVVFMKTIFGSNFFTASTLEAMKEDQVLNSQQGFEYGLGQFVLLGLPANNGHNGSIIYQSTALYFTDLDIAIAVQQNDERIGAGIQDINAVLIALLDRYIECQNVSSTNSIAEETPFQIFPNPASGSVNLTISNASTFAKAKKLTVIDSQGQKMLETLVSNHKTEINLENLAPGLYFLKINNTHRKILIQ